VIDKSESMEDVNDQRQIFIDNEPAIWRKINKWLAVYGDAMVDGLRGVSLPENFEDSFVIHFNEAPVILSEAEKLANLKARKELGLDTMLDLIMKDNPGFTMEQAEEKLKQILAEKIVETLAPPAPEAPKPEMEDEEDEEENEDSKSGSNGNEDSLDA